MLFTSLLFISQLHAATPTAPITVQLKGPKNEAMGTVTLTPMAKGVKITLEVQNMSPGEHAFHIHEKGTCTPPTFDSAGPHFAGGKKDHGFDHAEGPHAGDMPNIFVGADGKAKVEVINTAVTLGAGSNSLKKAGGTALVVHEKADDYKSQPAGNAGARIACGEIK